MYIQRKKEESERLAKAAEAIVEPASAAEKEPPVEQAQPADHVIEPFDLNSIDSAKKCASNRLTYVSFPFLRYFVCSVSD